MTTANDGGTSPLQPEVVGVDPRPERDGDSGNEQDGANAGKTEETAAESTESIEQPAKLLRIGSMVKQLLEEVRQAPLDEAGRGRLREIHEQSIRELAGGLSPDLVAELERVTIPFDSQVPSEAELRIAQAQLVGWL
ncbi:MAG: proteasome activator, partial [Acidimicrobiales bacterium]